MYERSDCASWKIRTTVNREYVQRFVPANLTHHWALYLMDNVSSSVRISEKVGRSAGSFAMHFLARACEEHQEFKHSKHQVHAMNDATIRGACVCWSQRQFDAVEISTW